MKINNFFKETVLKNDLTYLSLSLLLVSFFTNNIVFFVAVIFNALLLLYAWITSFKKRYIFNSNIKYIALPSAIFVSLYSFYFSTQVSPSYQYIQSTTTLMFFILTIVFALMISYSLFINSEYHYDTTEWHPESEFANTYREQFYLRNNYSIMNADNTIKYHYDPKVDVYIFETFGNCLYEKLEKDMYSVNEISSMSIYVNYLFENGLSSKTVTKEDFSIFKMFAI